MAAIIYLLMNLEDIQVSAAQILAEERHFPTVQYVAAAQFDESPVALLLKSGADIILAQHRTREPRAILEGNFRYRFDSKNYVLLVKLLSRLDDTERPRFVGWVAERIKDFPSSLSRKPASFPSWNSQASELPLVLEFFVRHGGKQALFSALNSCGPSPGIAVMLIQLEDMIVLNYQVFSETEYPRLQGVVNGLGSVSYVTLVTLRANAQVGTAWGRSGFNGVDCSQFIKLRCDMISELCRKASYLYLQSSLDEDVNLEVNQDKYVVEGFLEKFRFSEPLLNALREAEKQSSPGSSEVELKASMGHLRSFLEHLHAEAIPRIAFTVRATRPLDARWGAGIEFLASVNFLSDQEKNFATGLYTLISDQAVHRLIARREYARLARNVVIEYGLLFLRKLEKLSPPKS